MFAETKTNTWLCMHLPGCSVGLSRDSKPLKSCMMLLSCLLIWMSFTHAGLRHTAQPSPARGPAQDLSNKPFLDWSPSYILVQRNTVHLLIHPFSRFSYKEKERLVVQQTLDLSTLDLFINLNLILSVLTSI